MNPPDPVFICGHRKSGTTLLQNLLDSHINICAYPSDLNLLYAYFPICDGQIWTDSEKKDRLEKVIFSDLLSNEIIRKKINITELRCKFWTNSKNLNTNNIIECLIKSFFEIEGRDSHKVFLFKETSCEIYAKEIISWFPRARFIQIIRDPRDNFASIKSGVGGYYSKLGEDEKHSLSSLIYRASIGLKMCSANIGAFGEDRYMYLRYEDLCTNPRLELDRIANFLKIEKWFNLPKPTILGENVPGNNFENEKFFNINALNVGRWSERITREEAQTIEFHFGDLLEEYGYERKYSNEDAISSVSEQYKHSNYKYFFSDRFQEKNTENK